MAKKNSNVRERQEKILKYLTEAGAFKISSAVVKELSIEFDVTERQIYLDIKRVIKKIPKPKVDETAKKFLISWEYAIDKAIKIMRNTDDEIAAKGVKLFFEATEKFTNFMHQYGFKEQVPDKHEMVGGITINIKEPKYDGNEPTTEEHRN